MRSVPPSLRLIARRLRQTRYQSCELVLQSYGLASRERHPYLMQFAFVTRWFFAKLQQYSFTRRIQRYPDFLPFLF
jgi:hypothetical protein